MANWEKTRSQGLDLMVQCSRDFRRACNAPRRLLAVCSFRESPSTLVSLRCPVFPAEVSDPGRSRAWREQADRRVRRVRIGSPRPLFGPWRPESAESRGHQGAEIADDD